jgi:hypothetical protein
MFPQQLHCNRGTVLSVRSVPRCYKHNKLVRSWLVSELLRGLLRFTCELLLLQKLVPDAGESSGTQSKKVKSAAESRY